MAFASSLFFDVSFRSLYTRMYEKLEIGYESEPGAFTADTVDQSASPAGSLVASPAVAAVIDFMIPATPSFPAAANPVGHGTDFPFPTFLPQPSGSTVVR